MKVYALLLVAGVASADPVRIAVQHQGKWGFVDEKGTLVIPFQFAEVSGNFHGGVACADNRFLDATGKPIGPGYVETCNAFGPEGVVAYATGFYDRAGKEPVKVPDEVTAVGAFHDGLAPAHVGERYLWGYLDRKGRWAIPPRFGAEPDAELKKRIAACDEDSKKNEPAPPGGMHSDGNWARECLMVADQLQGRDGEVRPFSEGLAAVRSSGWSFIDKHGDTVIDDLSSEPTPFHGGLAGVGDHYIDTHGKVAIAGPFKRAGAFSEGFAIVEDATGAHYIDAKGKVLALSDGATPEEDFSEGLAVARLPNKQRIYVDRTGARAIARAFGGASSFTDKLARVQVTDGKKWFDVVIDTTGKPIWLDEGGKAAFEAAPVAPVAPVAVVKPGGPRFVADGETVRDTTTGLTWTAHDNGADIDADAAAAYAKAYQGGGWRLPTAAELAAIAMPEVIHREPKDCTGGKSSYAITPLIHVSCGLAWSSTPKDGGVVGFGFISGNPRVSKKSESKNYRALLVR